MSERHNNVYKKIEKAAATAEAIDIIRGVAKGKDKTKQVKRALNFITSRKGKLLVDDFLKRDKK